MKKLFAFLVLIIFLNFNPVLAKPDPPAEMQEWLKKAELGPYEPNKENWDEIVKKATEEGEVIVYTSSGRIKNLLNHLRKFIQESN